MISFFEKTILFNWKIKTYALVVSLILWFVILGQRSLVVTRSVDVEYLVSPGASVIDAVDKITMTLSAKRSVLQTLNVQSYAPVVDLRSLPPGAKRIPIKIESIQLPLGAKLLSIEPKVVTLYLKNEPKPPKNKTLFEKTLRGENGN